MSGPKETRAVLLLRSVIAADPARRLEVGRALRVHADTLAAYEAGAEPMPLSAQSALATFAIERVPALARMGHRLRAQAAAALDFQNGRTERHSSGPPRS